MGNVSLITKILIVLTLMTVIKDITGQEIFKTCSPDLLNCPNNSLCTQVSNNLDDTLKCVCLETFQLNPTWLDYENLNNTTTLLEDNYCLPWKSRSAADENKLLVYMRSPARKEHLAFGILMVLVAATLATALLYGIKVLKPLSRTKTVYRQLRNKRRNITPLQEMDELELNRRYEMQTL